jgi:hypothetical protein
MKPIAIDAPVGGWNAFSSVDALQPTEAIILDNLIPGPGSVDTREGFAQFADTGTGIPVETVATFEGVNGDRLIAASNGSLFDITDPQNIVTLISGATNDRWQHENINGFLVLTNGVDNAQTYTEDPLGSGTYVISTMDNSATPGVSVDFWGCLAFKGRAYYWKELETGFYYTPAGSHQGDFKFFDLGLFTQRGGYLVQAASWTQQDSGDGKDDFIVFVFSTGEVLVYQGDDPDTYFEQIGRYKTAEPLSIRGNSQFGSDTIIMTRDAYVDLSTVIQQGRISDTPAFSRQVAAAVQERARVGVDLYGWDCKLYPSRSLWIANVPLSVDNSEQHVLNTITGKWCKFTGMSVLTFDVFDNKLMGGRSDGTVIQMLVGTSDAGIPIEFTCLTAYQYLGEPGLKKHLVAAQVLTTHSDPVQINMQGYADFNVPTLPPLVIPDFKGIGTWNVSEWNEDYWGFGQAYFTTAGWQNVSAYGYAVALLVRFAKLNEPVSWRSTNLRYTLMGAN